MTKTETCDVTWEEVHKAFAPFVGSCLYAIRAEAFFHFALRSGHPHRFQLKNLLYPATIGWRSLTRTSPPRISHSADYLLVCDYAAEPGFGTLLPLLGSCDGRALLVVNSKVLATRRRELAELKNVQTICIDSAMMKRKTQWRYWKHKAHQQLLQLEESFPPSLRLLLGASRRVLQTLLMRAYFYESFYEDRFAHSAPRAVITHNDFTALSYIAGEVARRRKIPDFTLQHGFPSQEYFPASASHYLVWGPMFQQIMNGRALNGTRFVPAGAPRLDTITGTEKYKQAAREKLLRARLIVPGKTNVLFLSQGHTPVFSGDEHRQVLSLVGSLAQEFWIHMLVRPHPQEPKNTRQSHEGLKRAVVLPSEISLSDAVLASDVVVSVNSTAMLEAALLNTPVLQLALPSFENRLGLLRFPHQAYDLPSAHAELWSLRDPQIRAEWVASQQPLVRACVQDPGRGTENVWRYIRENSADTRILAHSAASSQF